MGTDGPPCQGREWEDGCGCGGGRRCEEAGDGRVAAVARPGILYSLHSPSSFPFPLSSLRNPIVRLSERSLSSHPQTEQSKSESYIAQSSLSIHYCCTSETPLMNNSDHTHLENLFCQNI